MKRTRKIRITLLLIIIVWIFQSMPSTINYVDRLQNQTQNYKTNISSGINIADILNSNGLQVKSPIQKLNFNIVTANLHKKDCYDFRVINHSTYNVLIDHRSIIRQSNIHYCNGNKYK